MGSPGLIDTLGWNDARIWPSDWDLVHNPFWTSFTVSLFAFPCLFYLTWYLNPSLSNNRLGLSWVMGFYSASLFTLGGFYEAPHLRTVFNDAVGYLPAPSASVSEAVATVATASAATASVSLATTCLPLMTAASALLASWSTSVPAPTPDTATLSFLRLDSDAVSKYYCFSDLVTPQQQRHMDKGDSVSLRHRMYQAQMTAPHLAFSLENYPDDARIGPHIIAGNFQAFLVADLLMGFLHYRRQLEPFSTVVHHIIYYFIVVHMRKGDMLSVFCILGTFIETSSIFLSWGRMFPHRRTPVVEGCYVLSFVTTRLIYVSLLWHEVYYNYPDKSVAVLYTITLALHVYWFVLYLHLQKKYRRKCQRSHLSEVLQSLAQSVREEKVRLKATARKVSSASSPMLARGSPTFVRQWGTSGRFEHPASPIFERTSVF
ncbi:hypothetical protein BG005_007262 [Podila minutissima]|nr:hypothetical protein BG005_007262 [Podila minutissima]